MSGASLHAALSPRQSSPFAALDDIPIRKGVWHPRVVEDRIRMAARALSVMPSSDARFRSTMKALWPDFKQERDTGYGYSKSDVRPAKASSEEINGLDEVLGWCSDYLRADALPQNTAPDLARIVWARATGASWGKIASIRKHSFGVRHDRRGGRSPIPGGNSHVSLRALYVQGLLLLTDRLNQAKVPVVAIA